MLASKRTITDPGLAPLLVRFETDSEINLYGSEPFLQLPQILATSEFLRFSVNT